MKKEKDVAFFNDNENKDYGLFEIFNLKKLHLENLGKAPVKWYYDASGYTNANQYTEVELKNRER